MTFKGSGNSLNTMEISSEVLIERNAGILMNHQIHRELTDYLRSQNLMPAKYDAEAIDAAIAAIPAEISAQITEHTKADYRQIFKEMAACDHDLKKGDQSHSLTGLSNKQMAERVFNVLKNHPDFVNGRVGAALVRLDLDGFKAINDQLGHKAGDEALIAVAEKIKSALSHLRPADLPAHYSGDEFGIILTGIKPGKNEDGSEKSIAETVELIVKKIISEIEKIDLPGNRKLSASAGFKLIRPNGELNFRSSDDEADQAAIISKNCKYVNGFENGSNRVVNADETSDQFLERKGIKKDELEDSKLRAQFSRPITDSFPNGAPANVMAALENLIQTAMAAKK